MRAVVISAPLYIGLCVVVVRRAVDVEEGVLKLEESATVLRWSLKLEV